MELEKQFAQLEHRGILPRGERMTPISSREPGNTLIWEGQFPNLGAAEKALKLFETSPEHTALFEKQVNYFQDTWVEFYEVLDC
ncbi:MAG: hypothetical protein WCF26_02810 [Candidatus Sulfotelmatobacter sp.]